MGFGSRRPTRVQLLNAYHLAARLSWARGHREWKRVTWGDESRFRLLNADGRLIIWSPVHEVMDPAYQIVLLEIIVALAFNLKPAEKLRQLGYEYLDRNLGNRSFPIIFPFHFRKLL
ncbi:uncharacterized protein TNCV_3059051 [Trichonephila clavipes]|nr:uncharacterized protein TNCV_3059051 [Trichonephila clavipes]